MIFMNPPEEIEATRNEILISNLLNEITSKTDIPAEQLEPWLRTEVGMTDEEIKHLKDVDCFPKAYA